MSQLSPILRSAVDGNGGKHLCFLCPGCSVVHSVRIGGEQDWKWNGDTIKPTFTPSILVTWPANPNAGAGYEEWLTERRCHSFVTNGQIQFLGDCTHFLVGQTVDLPSWQ